ncbi:MAG: ferredoxin [Armatimonadetes bacterium]|nr:ferredoxin [Armatimonadota bacterium]
MKVTINDDCISCGLCAEICPEVFEMPDEGIAIVKVEVVPAWLEDKVKEACESCPTESIVIE